VAGAGAAQSEDRPLTETETERATVEQGAWALPMKLCRKSCGCGNRRLELHRAIVQLGECPRARERLPVCRSGGDMQRMAPLRVDAIGLVKGASVRL
jgi:hypothetical protein